MCALPRQLAIKWEKSAVKKTVTKKKKYKNRNRSAGGGDVEYCLYRFVCGFRLLKSVRIMYHRILPIACSVFICSVQKFMIMIVLYCLLFLPLTSVITVFINSVCNYFFYYLSFKENTT